MQTLKTLQKLTAFSLTCKGIWSATLSTSSIVYGTTPQQRMAAEKEAKKRGLTISKYISLAHGAVNAGGGSKDPSVNKNLGRLLEQCVKEGIPKKTILNAIADSVKDFKTETTFLITTPSGMASLLSCKANSITHGKSILSARLNKSMYSGTLTEQKHLGDYFDRKGIVIIQTPTNENGKELSEDENTELAIEVEAEDVEKTEEGLKFTCPATSLKAVVNAFEEKGLVVLYSNVDLAPVSYFDADHDSRQFYKLFIQLLQRKETTLDKSCDFTEIVNNFEK